MAITYGNITTQNDGVDSTDKTITFDHTNDGDDVLVVAMGFSNATNAASPVFTGSYDGVAGSSIAQNPSDFQDDIPRIEFFLIEDASSGTNTVEATFDLGGGNMSGFIVFAVSISGLTGIGASVVEFDTGAATTTNITDDITVEEIGSDIFAVAGCQGGSLSTQSLTPGTGYTDRTVDVNSGGGGSTNFMAHAFSLTTTGLGAREVDCAIEQGEQACLVAVELLQDAGATIEDLGRASDTSSARALPLTISIPLGRATETNDARSVVHSRSSVLGRGTETSDARAIEPVRVRNLGRAEETSNARSLPLNIDIPIGRAEETDNARSLDRSIPLGRAEDVSEAKALAPSRSIEIGRAEDVSSARSLSQTEAFELGRAVETNNARSLVSQSSVTVGKATETDSARAFPLNITIPLGRADEASDARRLPASRVRDLSRAEDTGTARAFVHSRTFALTRAVEVNSARALAATGGTTELDVAASSVIGKARRSSDLEIGAAIIPNETVLLIANTVANVISKR